MRLTLALCLAACPAAAETLVVPATVAGVTVFPQGALIERRVTFDLPAGAHTLLVPGQRAYGADQILLSGTEGVSVGAMALATDRPPPTGPAASAAQQAAEAEVERQEQALRAREAEVAAIRARAEAEAARIGFLAALGKGDGLPGDAATLQAVARMVADETLAARRAALAAEAEAAAADRALTDARDALAEARKALAAVSVDGAEGGVLTVAVVKDAAGPATIAFTEYTGDAGWSPVYDLRLTRAPQPAMRVDRAVVVAQGTGEDWRGVDLVLSTAAPAEQIAADLPGADLRRIVPEADGSRSYAESDMAASPAPAPMVEPEVVAEETGAAFAGAELVGGTLTYRAPQPVDLRSGADSLRIALGTVNVTPEVVALAAPRHDATAFVSAHVTNDSGEGWLAGLAYLWLDGALVGTTDLAALARGDETDIGFGPVRGLLLKRVVPDRIEGDRGVFSSSTEASETAVITVENLTGETWPVRLVDSVPYSEQEDLEIDWSAEPPPTETDVEGERGVLEWEFDIAPGETRELRLRHALRWPAGFVLR
jgi:uncharacterized protein (TIGR02231 family)